MPLPVLITDGHWRKTLAAVRGLGREGVACHLGECTRLNTAAFSRYCRRRLVYPSPRFRPGAFVQWLLDHLKNHPCATLLAMEDNTIELVARHREEIARHTFLPVVPHERLMTAQHKDRVLDLARRMGIPTPKTWVVSHAGNLPELAPHLPYPVVVKPRRASGAQGIVYVDRPEALPAAWERVNRRYPRPLIQEKIPSPGAGYGASFLMDGGARVKAAFVHRRLREYPVSGGASTLRESVRHDEILEMGAALLKSMNWFGVAMVEFKLDPRDNTPKLLEINPRFWGSLALAIASGVNFPHLVYKMATGQRFSPVTRYRTGIRCRWLLPGDLLHYVANPRRHRLDPSFFTFADSRTHYDICDAKDPLPVLGRLLTPLALLRDRDLLSKWRQRRHDG
jgi:predicted ATP-grasp superfamily ATP-dependent carboligase